MAPAPDARAASIADDTVVAGVAIEHDEALGARQKAMSDLASSSRIERVGDGVCAQERLDLAVQAATALLDAQRRLVIV